MTVRAHFDGQVLVPDEPVNLPVNAPLDLEIHPVASSTRGERKRVELPLIRGDGKRIINPTPDELDASLWDD